MKANELALNCMKICFKLIFFTIIFQFQVARVLDMEREKHEPKANAKRDSEGYKF